MIDATIPLLKIYMLGRFVVYRGTELIEDSAWKRRKAKNILKLLILAPNHQLLKDRLFEWLWPDQDPARAANNLHRTLFILRRVLQPDLSNAADSHYIAFKDEVLALNTNTIAWVDVEEFEHLVQLGRQQGDSLAHYESARALYQGEFLPEDLYEDWARDHRETLKMTYSNLLQRMAQIYSQRTDYNKAISCLQDLLAVDPIYEDVYCDLMRLYVQVGQRHQALYLYQQAVETLRQELNVDPLAETTTLYQAILENRWHPEQEFTTPPIPPKLPPHLLETQQRQPIVGRESEMRQLEYWLQRLEEGYGTVVILSGEQGIGKTRLAEEVILSAYATGMQVLYGAAHEQEGHLPYGPFVEAIRGALDSQWLGLVREKLGILVNDLARLLPELAPLDSTTSTHQEMELGQERQRLFDAVATTFLAFTQNSRLVVFLDDLHAAGESSLQLLHYLARRISDAPILILCTVRAEEAQRGTPIARLCGELLKNQLGQRLNISPLDQANTDYLCSALLGGGQLASNFSEELYQFTKGNPFFVRELILTLKESDRLEKQGDHWNFSSEKIKVPVSVREVIGQRLERLGREAYGLAGLTAVIGQEFDYNLLLAVAQWDDLVLLDLLDELLAAFLIEETDTGYRFHHGLIRQVIYDDLTTHRRTWLHGQVAETCTRLFAQELDQRAAILAHHYERAGRYKMAFDYLIRAGDWARTTYASREALAFYNRAMTLYRQHIDLATGDTLAGLLERRAQTHMALSDFEAAIEDLERLLKANQEVGDRSKEGEALYQLGIAHYWAHRLPKATAYLEQAMQMAQDLDYHELYTKSLKLRDILHSTKGEIQKVTVTEGEPITTEAATFPAEEHWGLAMLAHLRSDFETAIHHAQACIDLGQSFANTFLMLGGYFVLGMSHASSGHYQLALDHLMHALDLSGTAEDRFWRARLLNTIGWVHRELFNFEQAIHFDEASLALSRLGEPRLTEAEGNALANLATDYLLLKDYDQVRAYLAEGLEPSEREPFMRWRYTTRMIVVKGRLALAEGRLNDALAAADDALALARDTQARKNIARSCRLRGETLLAAGDVDKARAALRHSLSIGLSLRCPSLIWPCHVALAHVEEMAGNAEIAKTYYVNAAEILNQLAQRLTDPALRQSFLTARYVPEIFLRAGR